MKAVFFHAGCPVCVSAEQSVLAAFDKNRVDVEVVHLGDEANRIPEAEKLGIKSVPALTLDTDSTASDVALKGNSFSSPSPEFQSAVVLSVSK